MKQHTHVPAMTFEEASEGHDQLPLKHNGQRKEANKQKTQVLTPHTCSTARCDDEELSVLQLTLNSQIHILIYALRHQNK